MKVLSAEQVAAASPYPALIAALRRGLDRTLVVPERGVFELTGNGDTLLTMPAWRPGGLGGVKVVTVYPGNPAMGMASVTGVFVVFDTHNGIPIAVLDGTELTNRRTAAVSTLATELLARPDATRLLIIGTGALAGALTAAHTSARAYALLEVWARDQDKAQRFAKARQAEGIRMRAAPDLPASVAAADVIVTATTATAAIVRREWVRAGTHLSLMGAFTKEMAEADQALIAAARLFADSRWSVIVKGGEVAKAITEGVIAEGAIEQDLVELLAGDKAVLRARDDITVFKSVGSAAFDLVAAELVLGQPVA